jgi:hypothetical protein
VDLLKFAEEAQRDYKKPSMNRKGPELIAGIMMVPR